MDERPFVVAIVIAAILVAASMTSKSILVGCRPIPSQMPLVSYDASAPDATISHDPGM